MYVLLTGASGFVGRAIVERLSSSPGHRLVAGYRRAERSRREGVASCHVPELGLDADWSQALTNIGVVVHSAARVHVMDDQSADPLAEFRRVNVEGTLDLARQAAVAGVKRFIFLSSIKVNGEGTDTSKPYTAFDLPAPQDPYGISKMEAEQGLMLIAQETAMEVVIVRPVLVYGPGVKANFRSMMGWMNKGVPLPLGAVANRRSLVAVDNLVDLVVTCIDHPAAANQTFLVSDGHDLSTTELLKRTAQALGKTARLIPVPVGLLKLGAGIVGKRAVAQRLFGSLQVDIAHTCETLEWKPPVSVDEAMKKTADAFLAEH